MVNPGDFHFDAKYKFIDIGSECQGFWKQFSHRLLPVKKEPSFCT